MSPTYLGRVERGEASPGVDILGRIATALGVPPEQLVTLGRTDATESSLEVIKQQVRAHFERVLKQDDAVSLQALAVVLGHLYNSMARRNQ
jgi:transcriptional regulator with XRE-family HTH domain